MRKFLVAFLVMVSMVSCKSYRINVNLENSDGKTVYLQRYDNAEIITLDSVVAKNNMATFKLKPTKDNDAYLIMIKGWRRPLTVFADNQDVVIKGDCQKYNKIDINASESQIKLLKFYDAANVIEDDKDLYYHVLTFAKENIDNPLSPYIIYQYKWLYDIDDLKTICSAMPDNVESQYKPLIAQYIDGLKLTTPGMPFIDFTQKDINGEDFKMSSVFGKAKVVILDFWASWCPDCRKENPQLVALYNEFKNKGLEIVSVSLDNDEAAWKKAVEADKLTWKNHVSDLKGWNNDVARQYTIAFIPQQIIYNEKGNLIGKNLLMEELHDLLEEKLK